MIPGISVYGPEVKEDFARHIEERANKKVGELIMEKIDVIMKDVFSNTAVTTIHSFIDDGLVANPKLLANAKKFVVTEGEILDINTTNNPVGIQGGGSRKRTFRHNRRTQKRRPSMKGGAPVDEKLVHENQLETQLLQLLQRKLGHDSISPNPVLKQNDADTTPKLTNLVTLLKGIGEYSLDAIDKTAIKFQESMTTPRNMEMLKAIFECVLQNKFKRVLKEKLTVKLQEQVFYGHSQEELDDIITEAINDNRSTIIQKAFDEGNISLIKLKEKTVLQPQDNQI